MYNTECVMRESNPACDRENVVSIIENLYPDECQKRTLKRIEQSLSLTLLLIFQRSKISRKINMIDKTKNTILSYLNELLPFL